MSTNTNLQEELFYGQLINMPLKFILDIQGIDIRPFSSFVSVGKKGFVGCRSFLSINLSYNAASTLCREGLSYEEVAVRYEKLLDFPVFFHHKEEYDENHKEIIDKNLECFHARRFFIIGPNSKLSPKSTECLNVTIRGMAEICHNLLSIPRIKETYDSNTN